MILHMDMFNPARGLRRLLALGAELDVKPLNCRISSGTVDIASLGRIGKAGRDSHEDVIVEVVMTSRLLPRRGPMGSI